MEKTFIIEGKIQSKQRPRFVRRGKFVSTYTPKETVKYEERVKYHFLAISPEMSDYIGNVNITIKAHFEPPKSISKKKYEELIGKPYLKKSDCDNIAKIICDGLNGVAYKDDCQISKLNVIKDYQRESYVEITLDYGD